VRGLAAGPTGCGRLATALAALLLASALGGCGGDGDPGSTETPTAASNSSTAPPATAPLNVSGGGSAQFRAKGGDNSVPNYGSEAARSELTQAAETLHAYMVARAKHDWAKSCAYLSAEARKSAEQLAAAPGSDCASGLAAFSKGVTPSAARELTVIDAASLRADGPRGFLLYRGAGDTPFSMPMVREGETWTVGLLLPSQLLAG
jgi:hypothetical protein